MNTMEHKEYISCTRWLIDKFPKYNILMFIMREFYILAFVQLIICSLEHALQKYFFVINIGTMETYKTEHKHDGTKNMFLASSGS